MFTQPRLFSKGGDGTHWNRLSDLTFARLGLTVEIQGNESRLLFSYLVLPLSIGLRIMPP